jgi:triacylglycerol lipase
MDDVWLRLRELGDHFTPAQLQATRALFVPRALRPAAVGAAVTRDLAYGPDDRHRLDIFTAAQPDALRPVVLFVHGGGYAFGDKGAPNDLFYNNVGAWAVRNGFVGVTMSYRLAPAHTWPAGSADVDRAVRWLRSHLAAFGGDASRIVTIGHSAGAAHVAGYLARHGCEPGSRADAAAAVFMSGIFALQMYPDNYEYQIYYGTDRRLDAERSTVAALAESSIPALFTVSEFDPSEFHEQFAAVFGARVRSRHRCPEFMLQRNHNHVSAVMQLGCDIDTLGAALAEFIRQRVAVSPVSDGGRRGG